MKGIAITAKQASVGLENPGNGVYIQDTDGYFYFIADWDGSRTPNGVALITPNCRFLIALEYSGEVTWGGYGTTVPNILTTTNSDTAITDYNGYENTANIINKLGSNAVAATYCNNYTFPNGIKGYLGSAGEWETLYGNSALLNKAMKKCGGAGVSIGELPYWTSTQYNAYYSWRAYYPLPNYSSKDASWYARALGKI